MKKKLPFVILFTVVLIIILHLTYKRVTWNNSDKIFVIGLVDGKQGGNGPARDRYSYIIKDIKYFGAGYDLEQKCYYIVKVLDKDYSRHGILIKKTVDPNDLVPQPPEGWDECPINEDGTIKAKYRRRDKNGNIIKSKPTDKSSIEKKKNKDEEEIDEQALDLIFENRK